MKNSKIEKFSVKVKNSGVYGTFNNIFMINGFQPINFKRKDKIKRIYG